MRTGHLILSAVAILLTTAVTRAYLAPNEVFTDLVIPELPPSTERTEPQAEEPEESAPGENPFDLPEAESDAEATPEPKADTSEPSSAPLQKFYRSGESIETREKAMPAPSDIFEDALQQEEEAVPALEQTDPELLQESETPEENLVPDAPETTQETKPAAKQSSPVGVLLGRIKYLMAAVGLSVGALLYFFARKKSAPSQAPVQKMPPTPENPQTPEQSSKRLEHALTAPPAQ